MTDDKRRLEIDRMVDGELDPQAQRDLLRACELHDCWRDLALAYAESQAWRAEFQAMSKQPLTKPLQIASAHRKSRHGEWNNSLALVVAILLSLGLGYGLGGLWHDTPQQAGGVPRTKVAASSPASQERAERSLDSLPLMLADSSLGLKQVDLPIVKASDLHPNWLEQLGAGELVPLSEELRPGGLNVRRTHVLAPVRLRDGSRVVVPIEYYIEQNYQ